MEKMRYIPKGAIKVADKKSDAVAYLYSTPKGDPAAKVFFGKQSKPVLGCYFIPCKDKSADKMRAERIAEFFKWRQEHQARKQEARAKEQALGRKVEVGHVFVTSWGYEQTNKNFYQVVELVGAKSAKVCAIGSIEAPKGNEPWMTGHVIPAIDNFKGDPMLVRISGMSCKIDGHYASLWDGKPEWYSSYA